VWGCTGTQRIQQVKLLQQQRSVEDLMYASILHKFVSQLKVDLLPSLDGVVEIGERPVRSAVGGSCAGFELAEELQQFFKRRNESLWAYPTNAFAAAWFTTPRPHRSISSAVSSAPTLPCPQRASHQHRLCRYAYMSE
jgi:hypothetical protein